MILIQFIKRWRMYQPGEVAGFDDDMANSIVAGGFAVAVGEEGEAVAEGIEPEAGAAAPVKRVAGGKPKGGALPKQGAGADTVAGAAGDDTLAVAQDTVASATGESQSI